MKVATAVYGFDNTVVFRLSPAHVENGELNEFVSVTEYHAPAAVETVVSVKPGRLNPDAPLHRTFQGVADITYALEQLGYTVDVSAIQTPTEADLVKMAGLPQFQGRSAVALFDAAGEMVGNYYSTSDIFTVLYAHRKFSNFTRIVVRGPGG